MKTKVQKWGNSLAVRIPSVYVKEVDLHSEDSVDITVSDGKILVSPVTPKKYDLKELLAGITKKNLHGEVGTGEPQGREIW